jgi:hypothetical protein
MRVAFVAVLLPVLVQHPAPDPFAAQRDAAAAQSPLSSQFSISFADGRRTFHPGETIAITFSYDRVSPSPFNYEHWDHLGASRAVLDRTDGTVYPFEDYDRARIYQPGGILGGVRGCVVGAVRLPLTLDGYGDPLPALEPPKCWPIEFTVYLNQDVRFDSPGRYRFYVVDDHVSILNGSMAGRPDVPSLISNILEVEITARGAEWEAQTAAAAIEALDRPDDYKSRTSAARVLSFLGSDGAVDEMVRRVGTVDPLESAVRHDQTVRFVKGLFGARDRARVIRLMEAGLDDPRRSVKWPYIPTLAALSLARPGAGRKLTAANQRERIRQYERRRATVLAQGIR